MLINISHTPLSGIARAFHAKKYNQNSADIMRERYDQRMESIERAHLGVIRQIFEKYQQPIPQHFQPRSEQSLKKEFEQER